MVTFVEKYGRATKTVLNDVLPRSGGSINWRDFSWTHALSNNFGAALQRIGVVTKVRNGVYKSNVTTYYVTKEKADKIAYVIHKNRLMKEPHNTLSLAKAKAELVLNGIIPSKKDSAAKAKKQK